MRGVLVSRPSLDLLAQNLLQDLENTAMKFNDVGVTNLERKASYPKVDISEDNDCVYIEAAVPGLTKDEVDVHFHEGSLTISGSSQHATNRQYGTKEVSRSKFSRVFNINEEYVDPTTISAEVKNGLLTIVIDKREEVKPKQPLKIAVKG